MQPVSRHLFARLPLPLSRTVLTFLDIDALLALSFVSKELQEKSSEPFIWKNVALLYSVSPSTPSSAKQEVLKKIETILKGLIDGQIADKPSLLLPEHQGQDKAAVFTSIRARIQAHFSWKTLKDLNASENPLYLGDGAYLLKNEPSFIRSLLFCGLKVEKRDRTEIALSWAESFLFTSKIDVLFDIFSMLDQRGILFNPYEEFINLYCFCFKNKATGFPNFLMAIQRSIKGLLERDILAKETDLNQAIQKKCILLVPIMLQAKAIPSLTTLRLYQAMPMGNSKKSIEVYELYLKAITLGIKLRVEETENTPPAPKRLCVEKTLLPQEKRVVLGNIQNKQ